MEDVKALAAPGADGAKGIRWISLVQVSRFAAGIVAGAVDVRAAGGSRYGILEPGRTALG